MAFRGKRRKRAKYTWMPTLGGEETDGDSRFGSSWFGSEIFADGPAQGANNIYVTPIVPDQTTWPFDPAVSDVSQETLRDFTEGQDWLLKRIVGRLNVGVAQINALGSATPAFVMVGAAFFVSRSNDNSPDVPGLGNEEIDPLSSRNVRQPWIWRRTWLLRNLGVTSSEYLGFPLTNDGVGMSVAEGPVIDSKIARRIRREERLFFVINAYGLDFPDGSAAAGGYSVKGEVRFNLDYRILGAMRRSTNRSAF